MSKLIKLYLETSAWNFYFADDAPEKQAATLPFFEQVKQGAYDIFISDIVFEEIAKASEQKRELLLGLIGCQPSRRLFQATRTHYSNGGF